MTIYKATYARWLNTHSREHKSYLRRKRYPWDILSKIDFNPTNLRQTQIINVRNFEITININNFKVDKINQRYKYDFSFKDNHNEDFIFKSIFSYDGKLITIFRINDPKEDLYHNLFDIRKPVSLPLEIIEVEDLVIEVIIDALENSNIEYDFFQAYEPIDITVEHQTLLKNLSGKKFLKRNYIIPLSIKRELWINIFLTKKRAIQYGLRESFQCEKYYGLYFIDDSYDQPI